MMRAQNKKGTLGVLGSSERYVVARAFLPPRANKNRTRGRDVKMDDGCARAVVTRRSRRHGKVWFSIGGEAHGHKS